MKVRNIKMKGVKRFYQIPFPFHSLIGVGLQIPTKSISKI